MPKKFVPPHDVVVVVVVVLERADGRIECRLVPAVHDAEVIGRVLRGDLPAGAHFVEERRLKVWNTVTGKFEHVCTKCGAQGLVMERVRAGKLEQWN